MRLKFRQLNNMVDLGTRLPAHSATTAIQVNHLPSNGRCEITLAALDLVLRAA